jgi:4-hydroxybenzoate polyprenyltransferase
MNQRQQLTLQSPLQTRILAWMDERFPFKVLPVWILWYLVSALLARHIATEGEVALRLIDVFGAVATWSFFLLLRVFDEHKDYELDLRNYPERVLQSGLITLDHLKMIGLCCVVFQLAYALLLDGGFGAVSCSWLIMFGYSLLMAKEFFVGEWLEKRIFAYAITHQLIMPLIIWWMLNLGYPGVELGPMAVAFMLLSFVTSMSLEIVRKTRGPEEERDTVDSYSKAFGTLGSVRFVMALVTVMTILLFLMMNTLVSSAFLIGNLVLGMTYVWVLWNLLNFHRTPALALREKNEMACAILMMMGYLLLVIAILSARGFHLTF